MTSDIHLSVALITRTRPDSLLRCLESLRAQETQPFEVVVSDDSDGECAARNREIAGSAGCHYVAGPRRTLYANRNFAARQCRGTHIRTMDDDHTFPPGHFARCLAAVHSDPDSLWTVGEESFLDGKLQGRIDRAVQLHPMSAAPVEDPDDG